jgi:tripartite-type tricarboxylate transporter receptor subunit TctC
VTIIVSFPAGGLTDAVARNFAQYVSQKTGQQFIVDNKPGAGGNIGTAMVAKEEPDGYTFLHTISGTLVQNRVLYSKLGFDPDKDFKLVAGTPSGALPLAVHKSVPATNIREFVAWAKTNKVNFGTWAPGSTAHIVCQKLNTLHGLEMVPVHYRGEAPMWQDMNSGSLQIAMGSYQALKPLLDKDIIRPIAIPGPARQPLLPNVPTMREEGYAQPAFSLHGWLALAAPAKVPQPIIERFSALWIEAAKSDQGRKMMETFGLTELPLDHIQVAADYEQLKAQTIPLVKELNVKLD